VYHASGKRAPSAACIIIMDNLIRPSGFLKDFKEIKEDSLFSTSVIEQWP